MIEGFRVCIRDQDNELLAHMGGFGQIEEHPALSRTSAELLVQEKEPLFTEIGLVLLIESLGEVAFVQ